MRRARSTATARARERSRRSGLRHAVTSPPSCARSPAVASPEALSSTISSNGHPASTDAIDRSPAARRAPPSSARTTTLASGTGPAARRTSSATRRAVATSSGPASRCSRAKPAASSSAWRLAGVHPVAFASSAPSAPKRRPPYRARRIASRSPPARRSRATASRFGTRTSTAAPGAQIRNHSPSSVPTRSGAHAASTSRATKRCTLSRSNGSAAGSTHASPVPGRVAQLT